MMKLHEDHKKLIIVVFFGIISFLAVGTGSIIQKQRNTSNTEASSTNFDRYCKDGVYYVQKEGRRISCGRAPNCGGRSYESVEGMDWRSNAECWVEDYYGGSRCNAYCAGNIPLCCYKLAQSKNAEDCTWPERGYCLPSQCEGVGENCGGPISTWCTSVDNCVSNINNIPYISLERRLSGQNVTQTQPTNTPQPQATSTVAPNQPTSTTTPTNPPQPTSTVPPNQPTSTPAPINSPIPTDQQPTTATNTQTSYNPQPTNPPLPTNTPYQFPTIEIKSPKELAREVINPQNIQKLNSSTEKVFNTPKEGLNAIKQADLKLEHTANVWIERVRIFIGNLIN